MLEVGGVRRRTLLPQRPVNRHRRGSTLQERLVGEIQLVCVARPKLSLHIGECGPVLLPRPGLGDPHPPGRRRRKLLWPVLPAADGVLQRVEAGPGFSNRVNRPLGVVECEKAPHAQEAGVRRASPVRPSAERVGLAFVPEVSDPPALEGERGAEWRARFPRQRVIEVVEDGRCQRPAPRRAVLGHRTGRDVVGGAEPVRAEPAQVREPARPWPGCAAVQPGHAARCRGAPVACGDDRRGLGPHIEPAYLCRRMPGRRLCGHLARLDRWHRPAARGATGRIEAEEVRHQRGPMLGQDRLGMELDAVDRAVPVLQSHDGAVAAPGDHPQRIEQAGDGERVVPDGRETLRQSTEESGPVVLDGVNLAVCRLGHGDGAAEGLRDALVAQADAQDRSVGAPDQFQVHPEVGGACGVAGPGRDHDVRESGPQYRLEVEAVVLHDGGLHADHLRDEPHDVVGVRVVVVDDENARTGGHLSGHAHDGHSRTRARCG